MEDERTPESDDAPETPRSGTDGSASADRGADAGEGTPPSDAGGSDATDAESAADGVEWHDDGDWDPPGVERRTGSDAQAVSTEYPDMNAVIEPGDVDVENALFVALGVLGTVGLFVYVVGIGT